MKNQKRYVNYDAKNGEVIVINHGEREVEWTVTNSYPNAVDLLRNGENWRASYAFLKGNEAFYRNDK